jgi:hypothetical protein
MIALGQVLALLKEESFLLRYKGRDENDLSIDNTIWC